MQEKRHSRTRSVTNAASPSVVSEKTLELEVVLTECHKTITEYDLVTLVKKVKSNLPESTGVRGGEKFNCVAILNEPEKECFCLGMVRLGEAMTFCKDSDADVIRTSGIKTYAGYYADLRNYILHHYMYDQPLEHYEKLNSCVAMIPFIENLSEKLLVLDKHKNLILKKEVGGGPGDNFQFEYDHFITCLDNEFLKLEENLMLATQIKPITVSLKAGLENHVRNVTMIMLELMDKKNTNFEGENLKNRCHTQKNIATKLTKNFEPDDVTCRIVLNNLRARRKALSHYLDPSHEAPYHNDKSLLVFVENFIHLDKKGYCATLRSQIEEKMRLRATGKANKLVSEEPDSVFPVFPVSHKTELEALDSMERMAEKAKSQKTQGSVYNQPKYEANTKQEPHGKEALAKAQSPEKKKKKKSDEGDDRKFSPRGGFK